MCTTQVLSCKSKGLGNEYNYNTGQSKERIITEFLNEVSELLSVETMSEMVLRQRGVLVNWLRDAASNPPELCVQVGMR